MTHEQKLAAMERTGVILVGGACAALMGIIMAGCADPIYVAPTPTTPTSQPTNRVGRALPPIPKTAHVVLAVESQATARSMVVATSGAGPTNMAASETSPASLVAPEPVSKRGSMRLAWNPSPDPDVAGYKVYYGLASGSWMASATLGRVTNVTIRGLDEGMRYWFVTTAFYTNGVESPFSNEISGTTHIYVNLSPQCWSVSAYGVFGKTNILKSSTNLVQWTTMLEWVGNNRLTNAMHTNAAMSWFRVEAR